MAARHSFSMFQARVTGDCHRHTVIASQPPHGPSAKAASSAAMTPFLRSERQQHEHATSLSISGRRCRPRPRGRISAQPMTPADRSWLRHDRRAAHRPPAGVISAHFAAYWYQRRRRQPSHAIRRPRCRKGAPRASWAYTTALRQLPRMRGCSARPGRYAASSRHMPRKMSTSAPPLR